MEVNWTEDQKKVIDLRNRNILVSAAAGSGKTAVLVERIVTMVTDPNNPVDIDHLLIVTFTKAAAGEMRERIAQVLEKRLDENPEDVHLERQRTLVHNAQITTIDSFCQYVIRNYFHVIGLDPGFRVADEGELKLLKSEVAEQLIEECYQEKEEAFLEFVENYASGKSDQVIEELIYQLYQFSMSYPWPQKWLQDCKKAYEIESCEAFTEKPWMLKLIHNVKLSFLDIEETIKEAIKICQSEDGPYMYEDALRSDEAMLKLLKKAKDYQEYEQAFSGMGKYARLSAKKDPSVSEHKKEQVKILREQMKKSLKALKEQYFYADFKQMMQDMTDSGRSMGVLIDLACSFAERFAEKKREKNIVDFSDLEHFALDILVKEEDGTPVPTSIALELANYYEEILIDEYQDSNLVQELILTSISKSSMGRNNVFMVGDVKQSIYRFRLARPELFMEKFDTYPVEDGSCQRIDLHKNFRSRSQVLSGVNFIFEQIMARYLGNIEYDEAAALYPGASFPKQTEVLDEDFSRTEVLLVDLDAVDEVVEEVDENARELEARAIGNRILEIVGKERVFDKKLNAYRKACFKDIVILLRTVSGWAEQFARILAKQGIPAYTGSQTGYFSTVEIQTILALLKVIDNPRQEIPMAAVLKSPIGDLSAKEMALVKSANPNKPFYEACKCYEVCEDNELSKKLNVFFDMLEKFRKMVPFTPMHELLWHIMDVTGYGDYMAAMPSGEQRTANLQMLIEKAIAYESTSYRGLFNFVRYIENLQKYDIDFGEAGIVGEQEDTVRIMSIHKSKGLEFPIVFVAGMAKNFNQQDSRSRVLLHPDLGIGCDYVDAKLRVKSPTLLKKTIQRETVNENLGEELRVLYVALTRAKEKLIMTGAMTKLSDKVKKWSQICRRQEKKISFTELTSATSYVDWVMPALMRHKDAREFLQAFECENNKSHPLYEAAAPFFIQVCPVAGLVRKEAANQIAFKVSKQELLARLEEEKNEQELQVTEAFLNPSYPYEKDAQIQGKMTVSELKKRSLQEEESYHIYQETSMVPLIPGFMQDAKEAPGAVKGLAYHKLLEILDFTRAGDTKVLMEQAEELMAAGKLKEEEWNLIDLRKIVCFVKSNLGMRMKAAQAAGKLKREQPFMLGVPASQIKESFSERELVLVQGIIDAYFYEEDGIVLVDYKTDYVPNRALNTLKEKYQIQIDYYAQALERLTRTSVKEKLLYSFWVGEAMEV